MGPRKKRKRGAENLTPMQLLDQVSRGTWPKAPGVPQDLLDAIVGSVWSPKPVDQQPVLPVAHWRISEVTVRGRRERHVWGWNLQDREGRASTAIMELRSTERVLVTESGRRYQLVGPAGVDPDGAWVWNMWCVANRATDEIDVTDEVQAALPASG